MQINGQQILEKMLITREVQIRTTIRYHFTSVRMAIFKKRRYNKCWQGRGEMRALVPCWWEYKLVLDYGKQYGGSSKKKIKIELPYDPAIPLFGIYTKEMKIGYLKCVYNYVYYYIIIHNS